MARSTSPHAVMSDAQVGGVSRRPVAVNLFLSLRPSQWTKNLLIFAGLLFGRQLTDPVAVARASAAFVVFCVLSGIVYLVNDVSDRETDRQHPIKARRPTASGALPVPVAIGSALVLAALALVSAFM